MRRTLVRALALVAAAAGLAAGLALAANPNEIEVKPEQNVQDRDNIASPDSKVWVLHFKFKPPRLISVDVPGRGKKVCWYLWYQVTNYTKEPHTFRPDFELVTLDTNKVFKDQILPKVQEAIRQVEDPSDFLKIKNSVTIAAEPIPPSKPDAAPKAVTGVAIWDDVDPESNRYSIFVGGLSNGWSVTDPIPPETQSVIRRKSLQLNFKRVGDRFYQDSREIHFVPPAQWVYRAVKLKPAEKKEEKPAVKEGPGQVRKDSLLPSRGTTAR